MSILEELFNGGIYPSEKYIKRDSEYHKASQRLAESVDMLMAMLNDDEKRIFGNINSEQAALGYITERERFIEGVCIGAALMKEILEYKVTDFI